MRRVAVLLGVILSTVTAAVALTGALPPAGATDVMPTVLTTTQLPLASYADMAVAAGHGHVFVSGGRGTGEIAVTDLDGQFVGTIGNQQGATGLAVSADGATLYATLADGDSVSAIDTATLTERDRYQLGPSTCPSDLALAGGRIWFSYGCGQDGRIGSLDLSGPAPVVSLDQGGSWYFPPMLASASATQGVLVAGDKEAAPATVTSFDVSSGQAVVRGSTRDAGASLRDLAVTSDGASVLVVAFTRDYPFIFSTADMSETGFYDSYIGAVSVAIRPDGQVAVGVSTWIVNAFAIGENRKVWSFLGGSFSPPLAGHGLAWSPDGKRLYTIASDWSYPPPVLRVLVPPPVQTSISAEVLTQPVLMRKPVTMTGRLGTEDNSQTGTQTLHVTRQDRQGVVTLPDVKTAADGTFSLTDRPRTFGETVYVLDFSGTDILLPTQYTVSVMVAKH